jgi:hypothetical protein
MQSYTTTLLHIKLFPILNGKTWWHTSFDSHSLLFHCSIIRCATLSKLSQKVICCTNGPILSIQSSLHNLEATDQKFKTHDGASANQLMKAIAVAVIKLAQWLPAHISRSLPMRTVMPADAHAAPKVSVPVIYREHQGPFRSFPREIKLLVVFK